MEAIILAGGMGTRLSKVVTDVPKPMAPVNGKPFLFYLLQWIKKYPIEKIILSIGYKSESIINYFGKSFSDIPVTYVIEEKPLGTGGALKFAFQKTNGTNILVLNGDSYFPINLNKFILGHSKNNHLFSAALKRMKDFSRYGSVKCRGNTIIKFNEKKFCHDGLINGGIYLINRQFIESKQLPEVFSLEKEILEKEVQTSELKCMIFDDIFIDIGIPEDYLRAESILRQARS
jgi:D-glycero-alpha-D-manno-heptose 1-phosphate guanylyltransferase